MLNLDGIWDKMMNGSLKFHVWERKRIINGVSHGVTLEDGKQIGTWTEENGVRVETNYGFNFWDEHDREEATVTRAEAVDLIRAGRAANKMEEALAKRDAELFEAKSQIAILEAKLREAKRR